VTDLRAGQKLSLAGNGSISGSSNIILAAGAVLNATGRSDGTLTLAAGQTLNGNGLVRGNWVVGTGATVSPGTNGNLGILTATNGNVTLSGMALMKVNESSATNDVLRAATPAASITYGGTLTITNLNGTFNLNDSFALFSAASYSGNFAATNLPALGAGLAWNWSPANGTLSVVQSVNPNPTNLTALVSGSTLTLSWPPDHTGWRLLVQTNAPGAGLNPASNAWFTIPGSTFVNSVTNVMDPANGSVYYRMVFP
jgi:hypothetical protein